MTSIVLYRIVNKLLHLHQDHFHFMFFLSFNCLFYSYIFYPFLKFIRVFSIYFKRLWSFLCRRLISLTFDKNEHDPDSGKSCVWYSKRIYLEWKFIDFNKWLHWQSFIPWCWTNHSLWNKMREVMNHFCIFVVFVAEAFFLWYGNIKGMQLGLVLVLIRKMGQISNPNKHQIFGTFMIPLF